jgi:putative salt-induced outer membrane protein
MLLRTTALLLFASSALAASLLTAQAAPPSPRTFQGSASLGFSQTSGNANATTTNVTNKLKYTMKGWAVAQDLVFFYGEAENKVNANFWNGGFRGERRLMERFGMFVATRFDRNVLQGISSRFEEGVGVDITALQTPNNKLDLSLGGSVFQQTLTPGSTSTFKRSFPAARAGLDYKHKFSELAFVQQLAEYLPSLSDTNSYLFNTETALVAPLIKNLGVKVGYVIRYNSQPPVRNTVQLKATDTYLSSGITYSF